jgi:hypothetical protein
VIDYLESGTEKTHFHVDARHLLVGHVGPVVWMWMILAVCGTTALVVHAIWMYVGPLHWLCMRCGCMWDNCTGCAFYVDVCGTTALVVHAVWMYVGPLHWLCMLCGCMWDHYTGCACYVDVCGTTALVVHAMWM